MDIFVESEEVQLVNYHAQMLKNHVAITDPGCLINYWRDSDVYPNYLRLKLAEITLELV